MADGGRQVLGTVEQRGQVFDPAAQSAEVADHLTGGILQSIHHHLPVTSEAWRSPPWRCPDRRRSGPPPHRRHSHWEAAAHPVPFQFPGFQGQADLGRLWDPFGIRRRCSLRCSLRCRYLRNRFHLCWRRCRQFRSRFRCPWKSLPQFRPVLSEPLPPGVFSDELSE